MLVMLVVHQKKLAGEVREYAVACKVLIPHL